MENKQDWEFERSSGYAGYRNKVTSEWIYENEYLTKFAIKIEEKLYTEEDLETAHQVGANFAYGRKEATRTDRLNHFKQWLNNFAENNK